MSPVLAIWACTRSMQLYDQGCGKEIPWQSGPRRSGRLGLDCAIQFKLQGFHVILSCYWSCTSWSISTTAKWDGPSGKEGRKEGRKDVLHLLRSPLFLNSWAAGPGVVSHVSICVPTDKTGVGGLIFVACLCRKPG